MPDADQVGDALLERQHLGTERRIIVRPVTTQVAATQHASHGFDLEFVDQIISWPWHGNSFIDIRYADTRQTILSQTFA